MQAIRLDSSWVLSAINNISNRYGSTALMQWGAEKLGVRDR